MTAKELLMRVPAAVTADPATPDAVIQFETTEPVHCIVKDGAVTSVEGFAPRADVTVKVKDDDLVKMFDGKLNPMTAFMTGRLKVKGDIGLAQRLIKSIDRGKLS
jgi:putative sterol carrier protein